MYKIIFGELEKKMLDYLEIPLMYSVFHFGDSLIFV